MTGFGALYEFNDDGLDAFQRIFTGQLDEAAVSPTDAALATRISGTHGFAPAEYDNAKEMADAVLASLGGNDVYPLLPRTGLWAWLTFVLRDQLFKKAPDGTWKVGEIHRWYPGDPNDYQKAQRHLVRMPVTLRATFGDVVDHLLCGDVSVHGQVRESLTSQQNMFNASFQGAAKLLYFDVASGRNKKNVGDKEGKGRFKGAGSVRRLATVKRQLDVTWDLEDLSPDEILQTLPPEFDRFKQTASKKQSKSPESDAQASLTP